MNGRLSHHQRAVLDRLREMSRGGDWVSVRRIGGRHWRTLGALVARGVVERHVTVSEVGIARTWYRPCDGWR